MPRVLLIGAASARRDELERELRRSGFRTQSSGLGSEALNAVEELLPDAILLLLPEGRAGAAHLSYLRLSDYRGPLLLLGAAAPEALPLGLDVREVTTGGAPVAEVVGAICRLTLRSPAPASPERLRHFNLRQGRVKRPSGPATLLAFRRP